MTDQKTVHFGSSLVGRLARTDLSATHGLQPLYEALSNSLHALNDNHQIRGRIVVRVVRDDSQSRMNDEEGYFVCRPIKDIYIEDDGIGFTDANFESFCTADSLHKISRGGKGIGRLLWLKAFDSVEVESVFAQAGGFFRRTFRFLANDKNPVPEHQVDEINATEVRTKVRLRSFRLPYKESCRHKPETLADRIIRHFLLQLLHRDCPSIILQDDDAQATIDLNSRFEQQKTADVETEAFQVGKHEFTVLTVRARASDQDRHRLHLCANGYEVNAVNLEKKLPHLPDKLPDVHNGQGSRLSAYVSSKILDEKVNEQRTGFNLPRETEGDLIEPSEEKIVQDVCSFMARKLEPILATEKERSRQRIRSFITERRPVYRPLLDQLDDHLVELSECTNDKDLDLKLNTITRTIEIGAETEFINYRDSAREAALPAYKAFLAKVDSAAQVRLSQYIVRRRAVLYALKRLLEMRADGGYELEAEIHDLIFPMGKTSDEIPHERWNLWAIDERLAFHDYLASDKKLKSIPVAGTNSGDEPDLIVFNKPGAFVDAYRSSYESVVIVEFKRPMRDDVAREELPHEQAQRYIKQIRTGNERDKRGRPIVVSDTTRFYSYLVCDFTPQLREKLSDQGFIVCPDGNSFFKHLENAREKRFEYFEYMSLDKLVEDAEKRNFALFHKLDIAATPELIVPVTLSTAA
jgi:hypothetical protein